MKLPWLRGSLSLLVCLAAYCQSSFRVDVHLVNVGFSVRDAQGKLVTGLHQEDFEVFEDGAPQTIAFFAASADVPLNLGLVVDVSGSQESFVKPHRKDLETFLKTTLGSQDRAFLVCFGNRIRLVQDYSSSAAELTEALADFNKGPAPKQKGRQTKEAKPSEKSSPSSILGPPHETRVLGTAFYDAIYYSIGERLAGAERGRKALILFSDGEDNSSAHHMLDAIETAQSNDVLLFAVRYTDAAHGRLNARNKYGISVMARIARETGGADFDARAGGLADGFRQIGEQLRGAYELAFHSTNPATDRTFHKLSIRAKDAERSNLHHALRTG
jgi:Ca-activated chloride channel homolog